MQGLYIYYYITHKIVHNFIFSNQTNSFGIKMEFNVLFFIKNFIYYTVQQEK